MTNTTLTPFESLDEVCPGECISFLGDQKIVAWFYVTKITGEGVFGIFQSIYCQPTPEHNHPETLIAEFGKPMPNRAPVKVRFHD